MEEEESAFLVLHCKASDYEASTGQCVAPFWGPAPSLVPELDMADVVIISAQIAGMWAIGFLIKQARKPANY